METLLHSFIHFVAAHPNWAAAILFAVAFGESLPFLSLLFPGTALLLAAGTLVPEGGLAIAPAVIGAILGSIAGDGVSYWIGRHFGHAARRVWPFTRNPNLIPLGISYFQRYGGISVFTGRFLGPLRAVVPLAAGILEMPPGRFWAANTASAIIWAPALLLPGTVAVALLKELGIGEKALPLAIVLLVALGFALSWLIVSRRSRPDRD